ncbi:hypothetical protein DZC30_02315 [Comamonas testosteroni]|uniref:Uncharacterized protein n=1 Tax=Comamonas testosteroni TaxID=285 RepID=A0A373FR66_COMTE|nr:hypothetical protein [Comamonas testosteroni]RGE46630.1 hypothetical protein DZC30_02315 [Comamonas testosteroni]
MANKNKHAVYVFKPAATRGLRPGRHGNKGAKTTISVPAETYVEMMKLCDATFILNRIFRDVSRTLSGPRPGLTWSETVTIEAIKEARKYDAEMRAWADANNAAHAE